MATKIGSIAILRRLFEVAQKANGWSGWLGVSSLFGLNPKISTLQMLCLALVLTSVTSVIFPYFADLSVTMLHLITTLVHI